MLLSIYNAIAVQPGGRCYYYTNNECFILACNDRINLTIRIVLSQPCLGGQLYSSLPFSRGQYKCKNIWLTEFKHGGFFKPKIPKKLILNALDISNSAMSSSVKLETGKIQVLFQYIRLSLNI